MKRMIMLLAVLLVALPLAAVDGGKGLLIVTTDHIKNGSAVLGDLIAEKEKRGFTVRVVTESDYGGADEKGPARAAQIREWLVANRAGYDFALF
ncbi:MAG TPA: hypothetical protein P5077_05810, partial [bacterium]|nr:hypothetical protein [bacterium]